MYGPLPLLGKVVYISLPSWYAECNSKVTRVRAAWEKFHEYLLMLNRKGFSLNEKVNICTSCMSSCLIGGSKTWSMKEHELKLNRSTVSMLSECGLEAQ